MIIVYVDATYDYKSFYAPHIDSKLGGYGYSSDEVGYHWLQYNIRTLASLSRSIRATFSSTLRYRGRISQLHFDLRQMKHSLPTHCSLRTAGSVSPS